MKGSLARSMIASDAAILAFPPFDFACRFRESGYEVRVPLGSVTSFHHPGKPLVSPGEEPCEMQEGDLGSNYHQEKKLEARLLSFMTE